MTDQLSGIRRFRLILWTACAGLLALLGAALWLQQQRGYDPCGGPPAIGKVTMGGPFTLTDHRGQTQTESVLGGTPSLLFFGYTFCPDVCPTGLDAGARALTLLEARGIIAKLVFISIDPERDTPAVLADFVSNFHERAIGLSGNAEETARAAKAWRVYYAKHNAPDFPGGYTMDHSSLMFLTGVDGQYLDHFAHGSTPEQIAERAACRLRGR